MDFAQRKTPARPILKRLLLLALALEAVLLLVLIIWLGYLRLSLAKLLQPVLMWGIGITTAMAVAAIAWVSFKLGWHRRFRFGLRTLLIAIGVLSVVMAVAVRYSNEQRRRHLAENAISHIFARKGQVSVASLTGASFEAHSDLTDLRYAVSVSFSGTALDGADFAQLAKLPSLVAITVRNAPVREKDFLLLRSLPKLQLLVLENTGASDVTLEQIGDINPKWRVFRNREELKQWSLKRVSELKENGEL